MKINIYDYRFRAMKVCGKIWILLLLAGSTNLKAQESLKIGDFFEISKDDSLKVYYNAVGIVVGKKEAKFVRIGKRDPVFMNVMNDFRDYDHNGNLVFKSTMLNNYLNGSAAYFYSNGVLKEEGSYKDDIRTGTWKYYYPDGKLSEVIEFDNGNMLIKEAYSKTGGPLVINGNGKVKILVSGFKQPDSYEARGTVKDGKMNEKWSLFSPIFQKTMTTETFKDGNFIKGYENSLVMGSLFYYDYPRIVLRKFYANEALDFSKGESGYGTEPHELWEYKEGSPAKNIYELLLDSINGKYKSPLKDQWVIMGFKINENDSLSNINISSSIQDETFNRFLYQIFAESSGWKSRKLNRVKVSTDVFFSLIVKDKKIILPAFFRTPGMQKLRKTWDDVLPELPAYDN
ncbi:MORN repeat variant [Pedobacter steynii]|uniref:MORN repeat variant n=1 Tax=Pedobacter steynii TaxID=430522 RepID=A0A1G9L3G2_9SPHI|nr:hypothetical protein [Pedobacter steynii]NQX38720.1 hypothetical protein [Pedobacter steynii]SDL56394.1 MORN repeat variant [Pedobacter steynii]